MRSNITYFAFLFLSFASCVLRADLPISTHIGDTTLNLEDLEKELKGAGLKGWVHGAVNAYDEYVFTFREPGNFFSHFEFPLTTTRPEVKAVLKTLTRHDEIIVKGTFIDNHAPIKHITAVEVSMVKKFEGGLPYPHYEHSAKLPHDLLGKSELIGKVHAVANEGKILVIEYKDAVVPVYVSDAKLTAGLFRNDDVRVKYKVRSFPKQPTHVSLDVKAEKPIEVLPVLNKMKLVELHKKHGSVTGTLVLFPKSPQVVFNVFALQHTDENGVKREYTLVNFEDNKVFEAIRNKLQDLWDHNPGNIVDGRNKYLNLNVVLKATGTFNVVDPGQANPQILLDGPENIERVNTK